MLAFLFGVIAAYGQFRLPGWWLVLSAAPLALALIWLLARYPLARLIPIFLCGYLWACGHALWLHGVPLPESAQGVDLLIEGEVLGMPDNGPRRQRFLFMPTLMSQGEKPLAPPGRLRLSWYEADNPVRAGERWRLRVRLKSPHGMANPHTFDYEGWLWQQRIRAVGYVRSSTENRRLDSGHAPIDSLREGLRERLSLALDGRALGALIPALTIGDRAAMSDEQWRVLVDTGTNHLMAISGLHVGLVAGWAFFLMRWLWSRSGGALGLLPAPQAGALGGLAAALLYAAMAGFSIPTQRALAMIAVLMLAWLLRRTPTPSHTLALALGVVVLDPPAVLAAGFWLSFVAVALLLYGMGARRHFPAEKGGRGLDPRRLWWRWGRAQWLLALGLTPLLLSLFQLAPLSSPLANLIAVPWMGLVVVPTALLGTLALPLLPMLGEGLLWLSVGALELLWPLLVWLAETVPPLSLPEPPLWTLVPAVLGIAWMLAPAGWPNRWAGVLLLLPMLLFRPPGPAHGEAWLTLLDVGQGLAAAVRTENSLLMFDTGPRYSASFDTGRAVILPWMRGEGLSRIDTLVLSHGDNDHIGGARSLLQGVAVGQIYTSVPEKLPGLEYTLCRRGEAWMADGVRFRFIHPEGRWHGNDGSCVLRVESVHGAILLPGDIEVAAERALLGSGESLDADILIAPHHGSKSSSSARFIDAVAPEWLLYPVGYRNRYGHPHPQVVARYRARGITTASSVCGGALMLKPGEEGWQLQAWRVQYRRFWHAPFCDEID